MKEETIKELEKILEKLEKDIPVLISGREVLEDYDLPTIHNIDNAKHKGFGLFMIEEGDKSFNFDAGKSMNSGGGISWTTVDEDRDFFKERMEYDIGKIKKKVKKILEDEK